MFTLEREAIHSTPEARAAYNRLYQDPKTWLARRYSLARWILNLIRPRPGAALLDVACGDGTLVVLARLIGLDGYGVDISDNAIRLLRHTLGEQRAIVGDGETLPFADDAFDYVTNIGSLSRSKIL